MKRKEKPLIFFIAMAVFHMGTGMAHPVTPTLIVERGLDSSMFGTAFAAMMFCSFLFSPLWGKLCNYVPTKRILLICGAGYAFGQILFGIAYTEPLVIVGRMIAGVFTGGMFISLSNYVINTSADQYERSRDLTVMVTIQSVANPIGYFIGGMLGLISVLTAFVMQAVLLTAAGIVFYAVCVDDTAYKPRPEKKLSLRDADPFRAFGTARQFMTPMLGLIFIIVAIAGIGQNSFEQCFNYYIRDQFGLSSAYNGIFKAAIAAVSVLSNMLLGLWLQKKTDTNVSFLPVMLCCTVPLCAILFFDTLAPFVVVDITFFAFNAVRLPILQNLTASRTTAENSNDVMGFYNAMNSLGGIFGALFAGLIYDAGPMYPFLLAAGAFLAALAVSAVYVGKYRREKKSSAR